jgi:hypothetical protein
MKSPFKFLDSYTKDDREIFFGRERLFQRNEICKEENISPLQGLYGYMCSFSHWTMSNAQVFCAFSALEEIQNSVQIEQDSVLQYNFLYWNSCKTSSALKGPHIRKQDNVLHRNNCKTNTALKGLYILKQDNVLLEASAILISPVRA